MRRGLLLTGFVVLIVAGAPRARADVVILQNGVQMTGVLDKGSDGNMTLRVSQDGYVVLDSATVVSVQRQSKAENARLVAEWIASEEKAAVKDAEDRKLAEVQRAKGLVQYQGEWMTPEQFDRQLALDRLDLARQTAERPVTQIYVSNYYAPPPTYTSSVVYHVWRARRADFGGYVAPPSTAFARIRPYGFAGVSRGAPNLYDHEAGMGAGAHYGW